MILESKQSKKLFAWRYISRKCTSAKRWEPQKTDPNLDAETACVCVRAQLFWGSFFFASLSKKCKILIVEPTYVNTQSKNDANNDD